MYSSVAKGLHILKTSQNLKDQEQYNLHKKLDNASLPLKSYTKNYKVFISLQNEKDQIDQVFT